MVKIDYRVPIEADLAYGPIMVEVRDDLVNAWTPAVLMQIIPSAPYPYQVSCPGGRIGYQQARIVRHDESTEYLEPPKPQEAKANYREPTLRDLLQGPISCEVYEPGIDEWTETELSAIDVDPEDGCPFYCDGEWYPKARIPNNDLPPEQPEWEVIEGVLFRGEYKIEIVEGKSEPALQMVGPKFYAQWDIGQELRDVMNEVESMESNNDG